MHALIVANGEVKDEIIQRGAAALRAYLRNMRLPLLGRARRIVRAMDLQA